MNMTFVIIIIVLLAIVAVLIMRSTNKSSSGAVSTNARPFLPGENVYFLSDVKAKSIPSKGGEAVFIDKGAKGHITSYSREGTEFDLGDDFAGIKITKGDEAINKTVWVPASEFKKLEKIN